MTTLILLLTAIFSAAAEGPVLIAPSDVKTYVPGLSGYYNSASHTATITGRIHQSCIQYLSLTAGPQPLADHSVPFGLMATSGGLDCLKRTSSLCVAADSDQCKTLQALAQESPAKFKARVQFPVGTPDNLKVALARKALSANDHTAKLEATADCCGVAVDPTLGDEKPLSKTASKNLAEVGKITQEVLNQEEQKKKTDEIEPKPAKDGGPWKITIPAPSKTVAKKGSVKPKASDKDGDDDEDEDGDDKGKSKPDPGLQHVMTDEEIAQQVAANMDPYKRQFQQMLYNMQQSQYATALSMMGATSQQPSLGSSLGYQSLIPNFGSYNFANTGSVTPTLQTPYGQTSNTSSVPTLTLPNFGSGLKLNGQ